MDGSAMLKPMPALALGVVLSGLLATAAAAQTTVPEQTVDTLNKIWGSHPGYRSNHAKGMVVEGMFTPTDTGPALSTAALFKGSPTPITVRFSDSGGLPTLPDGAAPANPHGMSVKFHLTDGSDVDIVANSLKFFPVANGEDFLELLQAVAASPATAAKPTRLDAFFASHPAAPKALATATTPSSLARETYYGIDAFIFVDAAGKRQPFRFRIVPKAGADHLDPAAAEKMPPNFLMDGIQTEVGKAPVSFDLVAQLANAGDQTKDPTQPWPEDRKLVTLGTIALTKTVADSKDAEKKLFYLPSNLTDGIELSDDPLVTARVQAYGVSFGRRGQ
jgi:catalase